MNKPIDDSLFPQDGDNFALAGPWRISTGTAWRDWQAAAIEAEIKAADANGDTFGCHRGRRRLRLFLAGTDDRTPSLRKG
jgi:hypothetical protein